MIVLQLLFVAFLIWAIVWISNESVEEYEEDVAAGTDDYSI